MKLKDGGTDFPYHDPRGQVFQYGISLRDYFAGQALGAIIGEMLTLERKVIQEAVKARKTSWTESYLNTDCETAASSAEICAVAAYCYADEMLAARQEGNEP
jgi:hypothetical protein